MWLLEPEDFAAWVITGVEVPALVPLAIRADGSFVLYRGYRGCEPIRADGEPVPPDSLEHMARCLDAASTARDDGFNVPFLQVSAAGRWHIDARGRLIFAAEFKAPVPFYARHHEIAKLRQKAAGDARHAIGTPYEDVLRGVVRALDSHGHRLASFFNTFFVFDGLPVSYAFDEPRLRLAAERDATLTFRRYRSEVIDAALAVQSELSTGARYIRCILSSIESNRPPEFGSFGAQARALQPAQERYRYASLLRKAGRQAEADRFMPKSEEDSFLLQYGTLIQHPANRAALSGRLGEYLGCPAND
jgi:hypothetical protein